MDNAAVHCARVEDEIWDYRVYLCIIPDLYSRKITVRRVSQHMSTSLATAAFKKEEAYRRDYSSEADFRKSVDVYIAFYNDARPHQTLAYKSPSRFEDLCGKEKTQDL